MQVTSPVLSVAEPLTIRFETPQVPVGNCPDVTGEKPTFPCAVKVPVEVVPLSLTCEVTVTSGLPLMTRVPSEHLLGVTLTVPLALSVPPDLPTVKLPATAMEPPSAQL